MKIKRLKRDRGQVLPRFSRWHPSYDPPVEAIEDYLQAAGKHWTRASRIAFRDRVYKFYRWLEKSGINLSAISFVDLEKYDAYMRRCGIAQDSVFQYRRTINTFLRSLSRGGVLEKTPQELKLEDVRFPNLDSHLKDLSQPHAIKIHKIYVHEFYCFLQKKRKPIEGVSAQDLRQYEESLREADPPRSVSARRINMRCVHSHLRWLGKNGLLLRPLTELGGLKVKFQATIDADLPKVALDFLRLSLAHKKTRTVRGYKSKLKHFYKFLNSRQISIAKFSRLDFQELVKSFQDREYSSISTNQLIGAIQTYLTWLHECGHIEHDPEPIIGNFPRPRRPDRLPRYLYPDVDELMRRHLKSSDNIAALALYLMRQTGIRISDLKNLRYDCLRTDERGYSYMKVPIGKLNNERLFPLDQETTQVIRKIRKVSLQNNGQREPESLVIHPRGRPPTDRDYHLVLYEIAEKIRLDDQISIGDEGLVSHRLRHTFATTLVNADIPLEALRHLLGHRSINMTLTYAKVAPQKLRSDYLEALKRIEHGVKAPNIPEPTGDTSAFMFLDELLTNLRAKTLDPKSVNKQLKSMIRRIERLKEDLARME